MDGHLQQQIYAHLLGLAKDELSVSDFVEWFVPLSCAVDGASEDLGLVYRLDGILAEASSAEWTDADVLEELLTVLPNQNKFVTLSSVPKARSSAPRLRGWGRELLAM